MKTKYIYKGIPLIEYCKDQTEYRKIVHRIEKLKKRYDLDDEEIVEIALDDRKYYDSKEYKYYYQGVPLQTYCLNNNINFNPLVQKVKRVKSTNNLLTDEEAIEIALDDKKYIQLNPNIRLVYHGVSFRKYCIDNNIDYTTSIYRIKSLENDNNDLTSEQIMDIAVDDEKYKAYQNRFKYFYKNQRLFQYCEENGINYNTIMGRIRSLNKKYNLTDQEMVEIALNDEIYFKYYYSNEGNTRYTCGDMSLSQYCRKNGINYPTMRKRVKSIC